MEEDYQDENEGNEGTINTPKVMTLSNLSSKTLDTKFNLTNYKKISSSSKNIKPFKLDDSDIKIGGSAKLNNKDYICSTFKKSATSKISKSPQSDNKIKKVSFSSVQIVRVKNYKRYNKLNTSKKVEDDEKNDESYSQNCILF